MNPKEFNKQPAINHLRAAVQLFNQCPESFTHRFTYMELWTLYRAWKMSGSLTRPDEWRAPVLSDALAGKIPRLRYASRAASVRRSRGTT